MNTGRGKLIPLLAALLTIVPIAVTGQDTTRLSHLWARPNALKTNLLAPVSLFYERALTQRFALRISVRGLKVPAGSFNEQSFVNGTLEGKIYTARTSRLIQKAHPTGFFVNPYVKARSFRVLDHVGTNPDVFEEETVKSIGFGATIGYQWVSSRGFVVELFHGLGFMPPALSRYRRMESDGTVTTRLTNEYLMMDLRSGISVGYAF